MKFSEKLRKLRKEKGISQTELADSLFVSRSAVAKWENDGGMPSEQSLDSIAQYFAVSKEYLCVDKQDVIKADKAHKGMPYSARAISLVCSLLLFIFAIVISVFWVTQDDFEIGISALTGTAVAAFIIFGMVASIAEFAEGKSCRARFFSYGVSVGVGVLFACMFAINYRGLIKYGCFCAGAPITLIALNEIMLHSVGRFCKVQPPSAQPDKRVTDALYLCLAVAVIMCGLNTYAIGAHAVDFNYDFGILIFTVGLFVSVITAISISIAKKRYAQNVLAYSLGALISGGMLFLVPGFLDIRGTGAYYYGIYRFYEYLTYEVTAWSACCLLLIFTLSHYFSYYKTVYTRTNKISR